MTWAEIYGSTPAFTGGQVSSLTLPVSTTVEVDDLLVALYCGSVVAGSPPALSITDPLGNTWEQGFVVSVTTPVGMSVIAYYCRVTNAGTYNSPTTPFVMAPATGTAQFTGAVVQARAQGGTLAVTRAPGGNATSGSTASAGAVTWSGDAFVVGLFNALVAGAATPGTGFTAGPYEDYAAGTAFGLASEYLIDASGSASPTMGYGGSGQWIGSAIAFALTASRATLGPPSPASGGLGQQSAAWSIDLDYPAPAGGLAIPLGTDVNGNTFQLAPNGSNVTSITIAAGATSGTFYYTSGAAGTSHVTLGPTSGIAFVGNGAAYTTTAVTATGYTVSGATSGVIGYASGAITIAPNGQLQSADTVSYDDGGAGGSFTPASLAFANGTSSAQSVRYVAASASAKITFHSALGLSWTGSPLTFTATAGIAYDTSVAMGAGNSGQAGSATVTPMVYDGSTCVAASGATVGTIVEPAAGSGCYTCRLIYPASALPAGSTPRAAWSVNGTAFVDGSPPRVILPNLDAAGNTLISLTQALGSPRAQDGLADGAVTTADALWGAHAGAFGRKDASAGTSEVLETAAGTRLRTFAVTTSASNPFGSSYPVALS